jgi:hypothetical protein
MNTPLEELLAKEVSQYKGKAFPVKSSILRKIFVYKTKIENLHPNPEDEFSMPEIGPNYQIISKYEEQFRRNKANESYDGEQPLIVEKMYPRGYLLINGHHRWAAYLRVDRKVVPISITNLTSWSDYAKMLKKAKYDKRATFDLDEVILCNSEQDPSEKELSFPFNSFYKERIKEGVPALFNYLRSKEYDIWLYSAKDYSWDHIKRLFALYKVNISGVITGTSRKLDSNPEHKAYVQKLLSETYHYTLHIDNDTIVRTDYTTKEFDEYPIDQNNGNWAYSVMEIVKEICS